MTWLSFVMSPKVLLKTSKLMLGGSQLMYKTYSMNLKLKSILTKWIKTVAYIPL